MLLAERRSMINPAEMEPVPETVSGLNTSEWVARDTTVKPRKSLPLLIKLTTGLLCLIVANLVIQSLVIQRISEIKHWQNKIGVLERSASELRVEMADLESFDRIQSLAEKDLGMRVAGPNDYHCIAAVSDSQPVQPRDITRSSGRPSKSDRNGNLWARVSTWIGEFGEAMAQTP
ncbi:MAG TPA: hypothetical protein VF531_02285 [Bacillota bacterium]